MRTFNKVSIVVELLFLMLFFFLFVKIDLALQEPDPYAGGAFALMFLFLIFIGAMGWLVMQVIMISVKKKWGDRFSKKAVLITTSCFLIEVFTIIISPSI